MQTEKIKGGECIKCLKCISNCKKNINYLYFTRFNLPKYAYVMIALIVFFVINIGVYYFGDNQENMLSGNLISEISNNSSLGKGNLYNNEIDFSQESKDNKNNDGW